MNELNTIILINFIIANIYNDKSNDTQYCDLIGFSQKEFEENFLKAIHLYCESDYVETELNNIKNHFNGYKFNQSPQGVKVYSSFAVIQHFQKTLTNFLSFKEKKNALNIGNLALNISFLIKNFKKNTPSPIIGLQQDLRTKSWNILL